MEAPAIVSRAAKSIRLDSETFLSYYNRKGGMPDGHPRTIATNAMPMKVQTQLKGRGVSGEGSGKGSEVSGEGSGMG